MESIACFVAGSQSLVSKSDTLEHLCTNMMAGSMSGIMLMEVAIASISTLMTPNHLAWAKVTPIKNKSTIRALLERSKHNLT
eukprot:scaffold51087_cov93-Phaeocystis_antarctica.AAC.1